MSEETLLAALFMLPPLLIGVIVHEVAHGYAALLQGDPTAKQEGRLSFNPIVHVDPFLTILVPGMLILAGSPFIFGGAKPVPIDARYFRNPRKAMLFVAAAGPISNIILAIICFGLLQAISSDASFFGFADLITNWLVYGLLINLVLAVFNMLPVPPLDGGRIITGLLPLTMARSFARIEPFGIPIVILLIATGMTSAILEPVLRWAFSLIS